MLYKNDLPYKLAPNDTKEIMDRFKKFPLVVIYPPERVVKSRSPHNRLPDKPNSISFPLTTVVKSKDGADKWTYAENVILGEHGEKIYTPANLKFNGHLQLQETDMELAWFLYTKSPYCRGGKNPGRNHKFMFQDLRSDAAARVEHEKIRAMVKTLIYGEELGLSEKRLRELAKAYFIKNVEDLNLPQVQIAIESQINKEKNGLSRFIEMTKMNEHIAIKNKLQGLIDEQHIKFEPASKEWIWLDNGKKVESITKVAPGTVPTEILYDYYVGNKDFQEEVEAVLKAKKS